MNNYIKKIENVKKLILNDYYETAFINHNKKIWNRYGKGNSDDEILCEIFPVASSVVAYSYFANILAKKENCKIVAYSQHNSNFLKKILNHKTRRIYASINAEKFIHCNYRKFNNAADQLLDCIYPEIKTKRNVESVHVEGIWIGDLLYDSYLRNFKLPTVDIKSQKFKKTLHDAISNYLFWKDYLSCHSVKAVILSHCVYFESATLLRIAVQKDISVYQVNATHIYRLNRDRLRAYTEFYSYPEKFAELSPDEQEEGIRLAEQRLHRRFSGEVGVDMAYSKKSAYTPVKKTRILNHSDKCKVLIATHCFFDSPHPYGVNLFPDFYEWLSFLGKISAKTNYEWYIKTHPDFIPANIPILREFIKRFPKFKMIPAETSHLQLIDEGISVALSVYGTIGFEYAALGIPVIYASTCNPCVAYDFNIHPRSVDEYERILMKLDEIKIAIDYNKVCEFYFMRFLNNTKNWLFNDYDDFIYKIGGHSKQVGSISYKEYLDQFSMKKHQEIIAQLYNFIASKDYIMTNSHSKNLELIALFE